MTPSVIQTSVGYVHSFNEEHMVVTLCDDIHQAKVFYTLDEVEQFINEHADAGYGFSSDDYHLVELIDVD